MNTLASGKAPRENRCADDSGRLALTRPKSGPAAGSCRKGRFATARHSLCHRPSKRTEGPLQRGLPLAAFRKPRAQKAGLVGAIWRNTSAEIVSARAGMGHRKLLVYGNSPYRALGCSGTALGPNFFTRSARRLPTAGKAGATWGEPLDDSGMTPPLGKF
jgi:hypothetical protein